MANVDFKIIGKGYNHISKAGKSSIAIKLDPEAFKRVYEADWDKLYMFRNKSKSFPTQEDYILMAPVAGEKE